MALPARAQAGQEGSLHARSGRVQRIFGLPLSLYRLAYGFGSLWLTGENERATHSYEPYSGSTCAPEPFSA